MARTAVIEPRAIIPSWNNCYPSGRPPRLLTQRWRQGTARQGRLQGNGSRRPTPAIEEATMSRLQNKVAVITGGTSGVGLAAAPRCVAPGAFVYIFARRP